MSGAAELADETVFRASAGSREDCARVLEAVAPRVPLMVAARLSPAPNQFQQLDDIVQNVLLALQIGLPRLINRSVAGLYSFLSGIVTHQVAEHLRRQAPGATPGTVRSLDSNVAAFSHIGPLWQFLSASGISPRSAVEQAEEIARLMSELGRLKQHYREVITLALFDQLATREIAEQLRLSRRAAAMLLLRAIRTLRRNMTGSSHIE